MPSEGTSCGVTCAAALVLSNGDGTGGAVCCVTGASAEDGLVATARCVFGPAVFALAAVTVICGMLAPDFAFAGVDGVALGADPTAGVSVGAVPFDAGGSVG